MSAKYGLGWALVDPPKPSKPRRKKNSPHKAKEIDGGELVHHQGMRVTLKAVPGKTPSGTFSGHVVTLQCPPMDPFTITRGHDSQEYQTVYGGTFSVAAAPKLDVVQFKTLFVEQDGPGMASWVVMNDFEIDPVRELLEKLSKDGDIFHLACTHKHSNKPEYIGPVTLTDYIHTESEPFTYYADVTFKEYRDPLESTKTHRAPKKVWPKHHKLADKDTLHSLAVQFYGKASLARYIATANHIRTSDFGRPLVKLGGKWKVGAVINLPKPPPTKPKKTTPKVKDG